MTRGRVGEDELGEQNELGEDSELDVEKFVQAVLAEELAQAVAAEVVATLPKIIRVGLPRLADDDVPATAAECLAQIRAELTDEVRFKVIDRGQREGLRRGVREIRARTQLHSVLTVLRARHIQMARPIRDRLVSEKDPERLTRWLQSACIAMSVEDIDWDLLTVPAESA